MVKSSKIEFAAGVGGAFGLALTVIALLEGHGFGAVRAGAWTAYPRIGSSEIDPYARANLAISGEAPLGSGEGIAFMAETDDQGEALDARCDYVLRGPVPAARFWTLSAHDSDGAPRANIANRYGLVSTALLRRADGSFDIIAARQARPGNWLPLGEKSRFVLVLRLYDALASGSADALDGVSTPTITRDACS